MQLFLAEAANIHTELLPPYAPELNSVENVWGCLKNNPLANFAAFEIETLAELTRHNGRSIQNRQSCSDR